MKKNTQSLTSSLSISTFLFSRKFCIPLVLSIFFSVFSTAPVFSQLSSGTFEDIKSNFYTASEDPEKAYSIAKDYLAKAKKANDVAQIVVGYELFVKHFSHTQKAISYTDSIILLTQNIKLDHYPAEGYLLKGIQLYYNSKYNDALTNFATANDMALESKNIRQQISIKHYIGLLKNISGEREEALKIFQENIEFIRKNNFEEKGTEQYLKSLFALADSYNKNRILDSAEIIHQRGIKASLEHPNKYLYPWFLTSYGITSYYKEHYTKGMDSLLKASEFLKNNEKALCSNYLYVYKCLEKLKRNEEAIVYLYKVDSIYQQKPKVIFQAREAYEFLNKEHKAANNPEKQLAAIEELLVLDEIITKKYQNLGKEIVKKYETPLLLFEKEELISQLQDEKNLSEKRSFIFIILSVLLVIIIFYFFRKNVIYRKRFDSLMESYEKKIPSIEKATTTQKNMIGLSKEVVDSILAKLEIFEETHQFTKKNHTLPKLAKELDTNSKYLSKVINITKGMNFVNYINELRIDYAITKLKENKVFRSYTIKAIAMEVGFNNAQSFSIAFHKKTGINPSYFLKQLENHKNTLNS